MLCHMLRPCRQLELRRQLDADGWAADVTALRKTLAVVDRKLLQMRLIERCAPHADAVHWKDRESGADLNRFRHMGFRVHKEDVWGCAVSTGKGFTPRHAMFMLCWAPHTAALA